jgi:hypothetical protein
MAILAALGVTTRDAHAGLSRSTSAPSQEWQLLAFASVPADTGEGDEGPPVKEPTVPEGTNNNQPPKNQNPFQPNFQPADTSIHADTLRAFPGMNAAPLETLGATANRPIVTNTPPPPAAAKRRHAIFGMPPLVLLAGLIALHIFVVTSVVK